MKNLLIFTVLFLFLSANSNADGFFILKNGKKIEYKKFKIKSIQSVIEIKKPRQAFVKCNQVDFFVDKKGDILYIKPNQPEKNKNTYSVMRKVIDGKISVYQYVIEIVHSNGQYTYSTPHTISFLEMGMKYVQVFNPKFLENGKKHNKKVFSEFFKDDAATMARLNSEEFKANYKNIMSLIREYNLNKCQPFVLDGNTKMYPAYLYRGYSKQAKDLMASVKVASQKIELKYMNNQRITLPDGQPVKICVTNGPNKFCDVITGSRHVTKYFEIQLRPNGEIEIENKSKKQFKTYIEVLQTKY